MSLESSICEYLNTQSEITSIVGNRIWRKHRQTTELPCVVFFSPTEKPVQLLDKATDVSVITIQFDCYSYDDEQTIDLVSAIKSALNGFNGGMGDSQIISIHFRGMHDLSLPPSDGSSNWLYKRVADLTFKVRN